MKGAVEGRLVSIVKDFYPQLRDRIAHVSSGSPLTSNFFLGTHYGEVTCVFVIFKIMCMLKLDSC